MNLVSVLMASVIGSILIVILGQGMVNQAKMATYIEYLNDTQTARNDLELRADCNKSHLPSCTIKTKTGDVILSGSTINAVGFANVGVVCDGQGFNVWTKKRNDPRPAKPLIPLKVCGGGNKVCNLTENSDGISCAGGSNSY